MSKEKKSQPKSTQQGHIELSPAVMAHRTRVRTLLQPAVAAGRMTEAQLQQCLDHADGTTWEAVADGVQAIPTVISVDTVFQTYDYNAFRILSGLNRNVDHWRRLVTSMAKADLMSPIIVNEGMSIIDGQNRFMARRYLGLPIHYIVKPNYGPDEMRLYNNDSKNWTKNDFVQSYSSEGREPYELLQQLYVNYPRIAKAIIDMVAFGDTHGHTNMKTIAEGKLEGINFQECQRILDDLMKWATFPCATNPSRYILSFPSWCRAWATLRLKNPDDFDPDRLFRLGQTYPTYIYPLGTVKDTCEILAKLYNKKARNPVLLKY